MAIQNWIGYESAEDEKEYLNYVFVETHFYKDILSPDCNFISGRKGAGKTAVSLILEGMLKSGGRERTKGLYDCYVAIEHEDVYNNLTNAFESTEAPHSSNIDRAAHNLFKYTIQSYAMKGVVNSSLGSKEQRDKLGSFLTHKGLGNRDILQILDDAIKENTPRAPHPIISGASILTTLSNKLRQPSFIDSSKLLREILLHGNACAVVIDTLETYPPGDATCVHAIKGMIHAVLDYTTRSYCPGLHVKCFIPGELYAHLDLPNPAKVYGHTTFVHWHFKDLMRVLGKRYLYLFLTPKRYTDIKMEDINWESYLDIKKKILDKYLPLTITNRLGIPESTLVYLVRHTHKKPRELIMIVNPFNHVFACYLEIFD